MLTRQWPRSISGPCSSPLPILGLLYAFFFCFVKDAIYWLLIYYYCLQYYSLTALGSTVEAQRESLQLHEMKPTKSANALITTLSSVTGTK
jgi:hypothetical protein